MFMAGVFRQGVPSAERSVRPTEADLRSIPGLAPPAASLGFANRSQACGGPWPLGPPTSAPGIPLPPARYGSVRLRRAGTRKSLALGRGPAHVTRQT